MRTLALVLVLFLASCATSPYSPVTSDVIRPFGGLGETACVYNNRGVYYVANLVRSGNEMTVSLKVYNKSLRTAVFSDAGIGLQTLQDGTWQTLRRTTNRHETNMTVEEQLAASKIAYNSLTQQKGVVPDPEFKMREKRIVDRMGALEQMKANGVVREIYTPSELHPDENVTSVTNFAYSDSNRFRITFIDDDGNHVEIIYERR